VLEALVRRALSIALLLLWCVGHPALVRGEPVAWSIAVKDIHGGTVDAASLRGHVTLVTLSTRETRDRSMRLGLDAGARFGDRPGFLSLTLVNPSRLSFVLRPLAPGVVADAEQEAVDGGLARQLARGTPGVSEADVRKRVIFVSDRDGRTWKALGVPAESDALHVGVLDPAGRLVHLARDPIDEAALFAVLDRELTKLETP
jgi:hypothetical protein